MDKNKDAAREWAESEFTDMLADCPTTMDETDMQADKHKYIRAMIKAYRKGAALSSTVPNAVVEKMAESLTAALSISTAWPCGCIEAMPCQFCKIERQVKEALQSYQSLSSNPTGGISGTIEP